MRQEVRFGDVFPVTAGPVGPLSGDQDGASRVIGLEGWPGSGAEAGRRANHTTTHRPLRLAVRPSQKLKTARIIVNIYCGLTMCQALLYAFHIV